MTSSFENYILHISTLHLIICKVNIKNTIPEDFFCKFSANLNESPNPPKRMTDRAICDKIFLF